MVGQTPSLPWACSPPRGPGGHLMGRPACGPRIESPKLELARWAAHTVELLQNQGSSQPLVISRDSLGLGKEEEPRRGCVSAPHPREPREAEAGEMCGLLLGSGASLAVAAHLLGAGGMAMVPRCSPCRWPSPPRGSEQTARSAAG